VDLERRHVLFRSVLVTCLVLGLSFCSDSPSGPHGSPAIAFSWSCSALSCTFQDESSRPDESVVSRLWEFGDGATSNESQPVHVYGRVGTYAVRLTVVAGAGQGGSGSRDVTVPVPETVLIGAGDIAGCSSDYADQTTATFLDQNPSASIYTLGDNAYPDGSPSDYSQCYEPTWGRFKARTYPAPGNHDYHIAGAAGYFGYFGPRAGPAGQGYYSYDLGSWHIISLNSEIDASATGAQAGWLSQDLAAHPTACALAYWHRPLFTSGAVHPPDVSMRPLFTILFQGGVDVVLSGHNHQYERFAPQQPDGTPDDVAGIRYFVAGTGGASLYDFTTPQPNSEVRDKGHGVLKLTLENGRYTWEFIPLPGSTFTDSGSDQCH
jgi:PKD domain-containing protein/calcineurin-like phosphoesterase family protein